MKKKYQTIKVVLEYFKDEDKIMASATVPIGNKNDGTLGDIYLDDDVLQSDSAS